MIPDVQLHEKLQALSFPQYPAIKYDAAELSHILDFFLALAVCNTVVVSSPSQPRHVVRSAQYTTQYTTFNYSLVNHF